MTLPEPPRPHRKRWLATLAEMSAIVIAVASLGITLYEAKATREHDRMSVWPRLAQESSDSAGRYDRTITNVGLGPALVKAYEARWDDTVQQSWAPVVKGLLSGQEPKGYFFSAVGPGTVLLPGHTVHVLTIVAGSLSGNAMAQDHRLTSRICYCSLYGECWLTRTGVAEPAPISECAASDTSRMDH
ncbi:MAG: hypothetical protein V4558_13405 [Gemmatimonadota bacterium]